MLIQALDEQFAPGPLIEMLLLGARFGALCPRIDEVCTGYVEEFEKNIETYARRDGFNLRLEGIRLALIRLQQVARSRGQRELAEKYAEQKSVYEKRRESVLRTKRW